MIKFAYKVSDCEGRLIEGVKEAESEDKLVDYLRQQGYFVIKVIAQPNSIWGKDIREVFSGLRKVKSRDLAFFCRQLAVMVGAGIPLLQCITLISEQTQNFSLRQAIGETKLLLEKGNTLASATRHFPRVFPAIFTNMVEVAEFGGVLEQTLAHLAEYFTKENELHEKIKTALIYPLIVMAVAIFIFGFLIAFILPVFSTVLAGMNAELPLLTKAILKIGTYLVHRWPFIFILIMLTMLFVWLFIKTPQGRSLWDGIILRLPIVGSLVKKMLISRFSRTLATLLKNGLPLLQAFEVVSKTMNNAVVIKNLADVYGNIRTGQGIAKPLEKCGIFPPMVIQMVTIGEEAGALDNMLEKISHFYDYEIETTINRLTVLLEPILLVSVAFVAGTVVLAVLLPILSLVGAIS